MSDVVDALGDEYISVIDCSRGDTAYSNQSGALRRVAGGDNRSLLEH